MAAHTLDVLRQVAEVSNAVAKAQADLLKLSDGQTTAELDEVMAAQAHLGRLLEMLDTRIAARCQARPSISSFRLIPQYI